MSIAELWRRLTSRTRRKRSFYESQEVMRRAVDLTGPVDIRLHSDEELRCILETDGSALRREAAERELELRAARRQHHREGTLPPGFH
ncbi:MAG: hypothetical protein CVT73_21065 [Alphaproteobacteria bacterium HGW-Alphaproteobacteria-12]|nr:MAG: hypothetical protein CVT73_21065 [Alphaproteobacteria bacterium HGW-Alphaproteobacteria-12]